MRSNGHDYEGLSYVSFLPFVVIDLINLSVVEVDTTTKTASIQSGVTVGQSLLQRRKEQQHIGIPCWHLPHSWRRWPPQRRWIRDPPPLHWTCC
ncbi:Berberine bridge enzyme-like 5 [Linum perenne]